jgi:hypothetical protein
LPPNPIGRPRVLPDRPLTQAEVTARWLENHPGGNKKKQDKFRAKHGARRAAQARAKRQASANLQRRDLTKGQKAMAMAMIYPVPERGRGRKIQPEKAQKLRPLATT